MIDQEMDVCIVDAANWRDAVAYYLGGEYKRVPENVTTQKQLDAMLHPTDEQLFIKELKNDQQTNRPTLYRCIY